MQNIILRTMTEIDLDQVYRLESHCQPFPWTRGIFADCLLAGYDSWVLTENETVVAFAIMTVAAQECHILNVCVAPSHRKQGLAMHLMKHLLKLAVEKRSKFSYLEVRNSNHAAQKLYKKLGFNAIGIRKNYYQSYLEREDAIVLALDLSSRAE